jgi:HlyD family secretion protein
LEVELKDAQKNLIRFQVLQKEGAVSQQVLDEKVLAVNSKREALNNAKATLMRLIQARRTSLENAQAQIQSAQANVKRAQIQVQVESAVHNLELANARLKRTIIRSPQDGQIMKIITHSGEAISQDGILKLGNTQQMYVVAEVYETDISKVKVGQLATIMSSALPGKVQGTVEQIGLEIGKNDVLDIDPAANTDVRVVEVKIRLKDSHKFAGLTNLQVKFAILI